MNDGLIAEREIMFDLTREDVLKTLENYEKIMDRVAEVIDEIGFTNEEFDAFESEKPILEKIQFM